MTKKEDVNRTLCINELVIRAPTFWPPVSQHQSVCAEEFSLVQIAVCLPPRPPTLICTVHTNPQCLLAVNKQRAVHKTLCLPFFGKLSLHAACLAEGFNAGRR